MKIETKKLTQGAMLCAVCAVFLILDRQMGTMITANLQWLFSIPMILYASTYELKDSLVVFFSMIFISVLISPLQSVAYLFSAFLLGLVYGTGIRKKWSHMKLMLWTIAITFVTNFVIMYLFASFFGYDLIATRNEFVSWIQQVELFGNKLNLFINPYSLYNVLDIVLFLMLVILESLCVHLLAHLIFIKLKIDVQPLILNLNFHYPKSLSVLGIVALIAFYVVNSFPMNETIQFILMFFSLTLFIVNYVYGMIVIRCQQNLWKFCWIVCLVLPFMWPFVVILGIADGLMEGTIRKRGLYGKDRKF